MKLQRVPGIVPSFAFDMETGGGMWDVFIRIELGALEFLGNCVVGGNWRRLASFSSGGCAVGDKGDECVDVY